jgi:hypothetical protein
MYEVKGKTTRIVATSRSAVKIRDNFYTIECTQEKSIPDLEDVDIQQEWAVLFDEVNQVVDNQITDIVQTFDKR